MFACSEVMVLVSKIRSSSDETTAANSFLNKIRSTFARSNSSTSLKAANFAGQRHKADSYSKVEKFTECATGGNTPRWKKKVESFDENLLKSSCDDQARRGGTAVDHGEWPVESEVVLAELENQVEQGKSERKASSLISICGSHKEAEAECCTSELDAQPVSPSEGLAAAAERTTEDEELPGTISTDQPLEASVVEAKSNNVTRSEVKGRLWEPTNPPAQAHPAWQIKRDKEAPNQQGNKTRFPARLPPLSSLHSRKLTGSTPVMQVLNLPEPEPPSEK